MGQWTPTGIEPKDYDDDDILSMIYNCTKCSSRTVGNATTAHSPLHSLILQIHKLLSTAL